MSLKSAINITVYKRDMRTKCNTYVSITIQKKSKIQNCSQIYVYLYNQYISSLYVASSMLALGGMYTVLRYVIKFVCDLCHVRSGQWFSQGIFFLLTSLNNTLNIVGSGIKH
jgi:hypothetical protein